MAVVRSQGTPWWMWVLGGCGCLAVAGVLTVGGLGWMGARWVKDTTERMSDPIKREEAAREHFGLAQLPAPWHTVAVFSVPLLAEIVILADQPLVEGEQPAESSALLVFASIRELGEQREKLRTALEKGTDPQASGVQLPVSFGSRPAFARGSFGVGEADVTWAAFDGAVQVGDEHQPLPARTAAALVECPGHPRVEMVVWAVPQPSESSELEPSVAQAGLPGDENALRDLIEAFPLCGVASVR